MSRKSKAIGPEYFPRACRGQVVKGYTKITIKQLRKYMEFGNKFDGFLVGNFVAAYHFHNGWHLACNVECDTLHEFETIRNSFLFYLEPELGNLACIYLKNPTPTNTTP